MPKIFISIASYLDPTLTRTMKNAIANASNPGDIVFGLGLQYYDMPDLSEFSDNQIRAIEYNPDTRPGIVRIRHQISQLVKDEDFFLQIDSHYGFCKDWDLKLIQYYEKIVAESGTTKIALLPLGPFPDGTVMDSRFIPSLQDNALGYKIINPMPDNFRIPAKAKHEEIFFGRVGQIFLPTSFIKDVGLDPYTNILLEIAYFSYRLLMSGYRIFRINEEILWQEDEEYFQEVWGKSFSHTASHSDMSEEDRRLMHEQVDESPNRFGSDLATDLATTWYEMSLAMVYNDYSKYAIKDAVMSPDRYWELQGQSEGFEIVKSYYNKIINNTL